MDICEAQKNGTTHVSSDSLKRTRAGYPKYVPLACGFELKALENQQRQEGLPTHPSFYLKVGHRLSKRKVLILHQEEVNIFAPKKGS